TLDALDRTTGALYTDGTRVTYTFDAAGRLLTMQDVTGVASYGYDALARQTSVVYPTGQALTYSFDAADNRTGLVDPYAGLTTYTFDLQSRLTQSANPFAELTTVAHDALDRELKKTLGNGMTVSHTYDAAGRETVLQNCAADGSALAVYTATYDAAANRL